eukprot:5024623-Pleurochrysis_carterae.AAC.1
MRRSTPRAFALAASRHDAAVFSEVLRPLRIWALMKRQAVVEAKACAVNAHGSDEACTAQAYRSD